MVDRFDFEVDSYGGCDMCGARAEKCDTGDYVLYDDYAKIEAENKRLEDLMLEVQGYLTAVKDGSMSRNNSENLACELLDSIENKL